MANETKDWGRDFLINELDFKQIGNTKLFTKNKTLICSPAVANKFNWFDLSEKNIAKFDKKYYENFIILLRLVNAKTYAIFEYSKIQKIMGDKYRETKTAGFVWGFKYEKRFDGISVWNIRDASNKIFTKSLDEVQLKKYFN